MSTLGIIAIIIGADILIDIVLFCIIVARLRKRVWRRVNTYNPMRVNVYHYYEQ